MQAADALSERFKVKRVGFDEQHIFLGLLDFIFPAIDGVHGSQHLHTCGPFLFYQHLGQVKGKRGIRAAAKYTQRKVFC